MNQNLLTRGLSFTRTARLAGSDREVAQVYVRQSWRVRAYVHLRLMLGLLKGEQLSSLLPQSGLVMDFGCGYGVLANYLSLEAPRRQVLGIDADGGRIDVAQATAAGRANVRFTCEDITKVELPAMSGAVMTDFLHHLPVPLQRKVLASVAHALLPGGVLLIRDVNPLHEPRWKYWCSVLAELLMYPNPRTTKLRNRKPPELIAELRSLGFQVEMRVPDSGSPFAVVLYLCTKPTVDA